MVKLALTDSSGSFCTVATVLASNPPAATFPCEGPAAAAADILLTLVARESASSVLVSLSLPRGSCGAVAEGDGCCLWSAVAVVVMLEIKYRVWGLGGVAGAREFFLRARRSSASTAATRDAQSRPRSLSLSSLHARAPRARIYTLSLSLSRARV
jgi:hypothetical protein